ncbi:MAG: 1,2-phenylacetyl-CoA epoxidase subunit PaaD [Streptosporangiales bacterium]
MVTAAPTRERAYEVAASVVDPEIPVLTIADLGVLRDVTVDEAGSVEVTITPTYSGCPALDTIQSDLRSAVRDAGFPQVRVRTTLTPAWTTDDMTDDARRKLHAYGIAPPGPAAGPVPVAIGVRCPHCGSAETRLQSRFGSTACKALYACRACAEPFDHFRAL